MKKIFTRADTNTAKATLDILLKEMSNERRDVLTFAILIPLGHLLYLVIIPLLLSLIIQSLIVEPHNFTTPMWILIGMAVTSVVTIIVQHVGFDALFNNEERVTTRLTKQSLNKILSHSNGFFANTKVGSLAGDVNGFAKSYQTIMDATFLQASSMIVNFVASLIIICVLSPTLFVPMAILTLVIIMHSLKSLRLRAVYRNERKEMLSQLNGTIADILGNQLLVRIFSKKSVEINKVTKERRAIEKIATKEINIINRESGIRQVILFSFQIIFILACVWLFTRDMISIAALVFTITYLGRVTGSMFNITSLVRSIEQGFLDASPITKILTQNIEVKDTPSATKLIVNNGNVVFKNVDFSYKDNDHELVFNNLNLNIPAGQRIGLAGRSGGGKTTLTQLLLRFSDVKSGNIFIDGQDITQVTQDSLHDNIAYVPQDPFLFHRSLRENIAYSKPYATDEEITKAAKQANATEFIEKLPNGLDTIVGERGIKLSGGQRQRVAIARAILKNAPILVLDEATSALDSESETLIQGALNILMKNRTSIVIAHRLSTIARLDRVIVLDNGKIIEDGTHAELLVQNGTYAKLWLHQSGGFIEE